MDDITALLESIGAAAVAEGTARLAAKHPAAKAREGLLVEKVQREGCPDIRVSKPYNGGCFKRDPNLWRDILVMKCVTAECDCGASYQREASFHIQKKNGSVQWVLRDPAMKPEQVEHVTQRIVCCQACITVVSKEVK